MKLPLFIAIALLFSCKQSTENKQAPETTPQLEVTEESHENIDDKVILNNGKLWKANPETTTGINNMKNRLQSFTEKENIAAYSKLKTALESDFTELFEKCTMKGEAHNQLHNYLFPFIDLFEDLGSSELETCKNSFAKLSSHLDEYPNYFE